MKTITLKEMNDEGLKALSKQIEDEQDARREKAWIEQTLTREQLLKLYSGYGYIIPPGSQFWRIRSGEHRGAYGVQIGQYTHSCHVDTTEFIVLLAQVSKHRFEVIAVDDLGMEKSFTA